MGLLSTVGGLITNGLFGGVINSINTYMNNKKILKETEMTAKIKLLKASTEAKVQIMKAGLAGDIAWENTSQLNSGWKDELWTILFAIPFVLCFVPEAAPYVESGFSSIDTMPDWYMGLASVVIGSAFGVRSIAKVMNLKSGVNLSNIDTVKDLMHSLDSK